MHRDRDLMELHVEALFRHDEGGRLTTVNEPGGGAAPRFFLGATADGLVMRVRHDVAEDLAHELRTAAMRDASCVTAIDLPTGPAPYQAILTRFASADQVWTGPAFTFPQTLPASTGAVRVTAANFQVLQPLLGAWALDVPLCEPMIAVVIDGQAVSICGSVRRTDRAHEAGVETAPAFRGRGYSAAAATEWARTVRELGRVPLYSTSWQNRASRAVARKIGLLHFGNDLHIT